VMKGNMSTPCSQRRKSIWSKGNNSFGVPAFQR
jgi:hypothetical protein